MTLVYLADQNALLHSRSTTQLQLLPLHTLPLKQQTTQERQPRTRNTQYIRLRQRIIIRQQHARQLIRRRNLLYVRCPRCNDRPRINTRRMLRNLLKQRITEDVLRDRNTDGSAQGVEEDGYRVTDRHVLFGEDNLHGDKGDLHAHSGAGTREDLVADPSACVGVHFEAVDHSGADSEDGASDPGEGDVEADCGDEAADHDAGKRDADHVWYCADSATFGGRAFDRLEVEGKVVDVRVEGHGEEGGKDAASEDGSLFGDYARWESA